MVRKRKPGGGRKPKPGGPGVHFNTRIEPEIRRALEQAAKANGWSLSAEIALRLRDSVAAVPKSDDETRALCFMIYEMVRMARRERQRANPPFDWSRVYFDFQVLKTGVNDLLNGLAPEEPSEPQASRFKHFNNPEDMGAFLAGMVFRLVDAAGGDLSAIASAIAYVGNPFNYAQAAKALKMHDEEGRTDEGSHS